MGWDEGVLRGSDTAGGLYVRTEDTEADGSGRLSTHVCMCEGESMVVYIECMVSVRGPICEDRRRRRDDMAKGAGERGRRAAEEKRRREKEKEKKRKRRKEVSQRTLQEEIAKRNISRQCQVIQAAEEGEGGVTSFGRFPRENTQ